MDHRLRLQMAAAHTIGGAAGGVIGVGVIWLVASPARTLLPLGVREGAVALVALVACLVELRVVHIGGHQKQVNAHWYRRYGPTRSYAAYGLMLGSAIATLRPFSFVYPAFAATALLVPFKGALLCGAVFGLGRTAFLGPASYRATFMSKVLYRSGSAFAFWRGLSMVSSLALLAIMVERSTRLL